MSATPRADPVADRSLIADVFVVEWAVAAEAPVEPAPAPARERWRNEALAAGFDR